MIMLNVGFGSKIQEVPTCCDWNKGERENTGSSKSIFDISISFLKLLTSKRTSCVNSYMMIESPDFE